MWQPPTPTSLDNNNNAGHVLSPHTAGQLPPPQREMYISRVVQLTMGLTAGILTDFTECGSDRRSNDGLIQ